jgi:hypothetical protein
MRSNGMLLEVVAVNDPRPGNFCETLEAQDRGLIVVRISFSNISKRA